MKGLGVESVGAVPKSLSPLRFTIEALSCHKLLSSLCCPAVDVLLACTSKVHLLSERTFLRTLLSHGFQLCLCTHGHARLFPHWEADQEEIQE